MVAAARAVGSREPDPAVRNPDYLATGRFARRSVVGRYAMHGDGSVYGARTFETLRKQAQSKLCQAGSLPPGYWIAVVLQ